jgi:cobalt-zinc-cadmium efflux system membrane fusion protein
MNVRKPIILCLSLALFVLPVLVPASSLAHEGHAHAPGEEGEGASLGPVTITPEAKQNLGLTVVEADVRAVEKVLQAIGRIEAVPSRAAAVSSRIAGRASGLYVNDGERVKKGQELVEVESLQLGDPPPRVTYRAPFNGIVVHRDIALGDTVDPGKHLMEVVDLSEVYAEGFVFEGQLAEVREGQAARVAVEAFPGEVFEGRVELVSGALDPETGALRVWVKLTNPEMRLRPNMRATLHIATGAGESAVAVPRSAVLGDSGHYFVFVQSDTDELTFARKSVVLGTRDDRFVEIIEGVLSGDRVVTVGAYQLQYVQPKKPTAKEPEEGEPTAKAKGAMSIVPWIGGAILGFMLATLLRTVSRQLGS